MFPRTRGWGREWLWDDASALHLLCTLCLLLVHQLRLRLAGLRSWRLESFAPAGFLGGGNRPRRKARTWDLGRGDGKTKLLVFGKTSQSQPGSCTRDRAWSIHTETSSDVQPCRGPFALPEPQGNGGCYHPWFLCNLRNDQRRARKLTEFLLD